MATAAYNWAERAVGRGWRRACEALGVRPEESAVLAAACAFQFCFVAGVAVLKAASNALLVGTATLPLLYVASSLGTGAVAVGAAMLRSPRHWPPTRAFSAWIALFLGLVAAGHMGLSAAWDGLYLAAEVYATTLSVRYWGRVGELFDLRQSRRLLGVIGGIGMAGSIVGGLLTQATGAALGAERLVPLACVPFVACLLLAPSLAGRAAPKAAAGRAAPVSSISLSRQEQRRYLAMDGLPRNMALLAALMAALTALSDLLFRSRAKALLDHGEQTALFGGVSALVGMVAMPVQLALTGPLLRRVGLFAYLAVTPVACALLGGASLIWTGLWPSLLLKTMEQVGALSLTQTGMQLLYGPMPDWARVSARSVVDGFGKKAGYALAGLLLFLAAARLGPRDLPLLTAAVSLVALWVIIRLQRHYVRTVGQRLKSPSLDEDAPSLEDPTSVRVLEQAVADGDEGRVLTALELLGRSRGARMEPLLPPLLLHPSAEVRAVAARLAGRHGAQSCAERLIRMASEDEPAVRSAAIEAVAALRPFSAGKLLSPLLSHPDLETRCAAIAALLPLDPSGPAAIAVEALLAEGAEAPPAHRARTVRLLGRLKGDYARRIGPALRDPSPLVRKAACEAAGLSQEPELVDELLRLLVARDTRPEARQALVRYGDAILGRVEWILNDRYASADLRYRMPRLLREIGTERALEVILFSNPLDDPFLQYRLCNAAGRIREARPEVAYDAGRVLEATLRRLDSYDKLAATARDLGVALGPSNLLVRTLNDRLDQHLEGAIRLTGLLAPPRAVLNAWNRFLSGDERTRPYAVELLDHLVGERTLARRLTATLERWHRRPGWTEDGQVESAPGRLLELLASRDVVLRAIAIATVRRLSQLRAASRRGTAIDAARDPESSSGLHALARFARGPSWDVLLNAPPVIPQEGPVSEQIVQKVLFLQGCDIFGESSVDDLTAVAQHVKERTFKAGEVIFHENDPGDALFVIVEGRVRAAKGDKHLFDLGPRDSFGETSLLDNKPRPASATALSHVKVLVLERADFLDLVSDRVELLRGIFGVITRDLRAVLDATAGSRAAEGESAVVSRAVRQSAV